MSAVSKPADQPTVPFGQRQCVMDVEPYPNFSMIGLRLQEPTQEDRTLVFTSEPGLGEPFAAFRDWYAEHGRRYLWVGFNSLGYDNHILAAVLDGTDDPAALKALSDSLIKTNTGWKRNERASAGGELCVDPFAMNGGAKARIGSLKEIACKLDAPSLRTLPYEPDRVLTRDEMQAVVDYNAVDLEVTARVAACQAATINARIALAREYQSRTVVNVHDAKLAELVLARRLFGPNASPQYPKTKSWRLSGRQIAETFAFRTPALQEMLARIPETMRFDVTETQTDDGPVKRIEQCEIVDAVKVGDVSYSLGYGGLHSDDGPGWFVADDRWTYLDMDVNSFYPALMINHKLAPAHLSRDAFLAEFDALRQKQLAAKAAGQTDLANGLKISINSVFGKSKSPYSWLCDPTVSVRTTLLGQFTLLWFIDALAAVDGVTVLSANNTDEAQVAPGAGDNGAPPLGGGPDEAGVLSANTDGLTLKVRRDQVDQIKAEMNRKATEIDLSLSWAEYRMIARRDVNNYIAVTTDGKIKAKGSYGYDQKDLGRKAVNRIVVAAAQAFFVNDAPLADTVRGCSDIREFLNYFKATKGYTIVDEAGRDYGGIARWYIGTCGVRLLKRKLADGKLTQLVEAAAVVVPDLPETFPADVNVDYYIGKGEDLVKAITEPERRQSHTVPQAELSKAQRDRFEVNKTAATCPDRCAALDLEPYHTDWANVVRGNPHDTMRHLLCRIWFDGRGQLTHGDLVWVAGQLDEASGEGRKAEWHRLADWIVRHVSPFPLPQTIPEHVARAMAWAAETIEPNKRRKAPRHLDVLHSDLVKPDALARYEKTRDIYRLACSLCAVCVKNAAHLPEPAICDIIGKIDAYLANKRAATTAPHPPPAPDDPRVQAVAAAVMCAVKMGLPPADVAAEIYQFNTELRSPLQTGVVDDIIRQACHQEGRANAA